MKPADIEAAVKDLDEYLTKFYHQQREKTRPRSETIGGAEEFDPVAIGTAARRLCEASRNAGRELTATEAVTRLLRERRSRSNSDDTQKDLRQESITF